MTLLQVCSAPEVQLEQPNSDPVYLTEAPSQTVRTALADELLRVARLIEGLKRECGMDPESPTAIQNGRYMSIAAILRSLAPRPLTDRQVADLIPHEQDGWTREQYCQWTARAIERAHGIGVTGGAA